MYQYNIDIELVKELEAKAVKIRKDLLNFIYRIGMGHLGGELSCVDVAVALYYKYMNYDPANPAWEGRDRFVLSKGHCSETFYTIYQDLGMYTMDYMVEHFETLDTYKFGMHSNRLKVDAIEVSAGSLGHGLPISVGMALGARMQKKNWRTFVLVGDGELNEGTNWEALMAAGHHKLGNLACIIDKNGLQMTGHTKDVIDIDPLDKKLEAFGWDAVSIDGNDMYAVCEAFQNLPPAEPLARKRPIAIIANTVKGKGVDFMEDVATWHGGGIAKEQLGQALASVEKNRRAR
ncbi:MAG: transketolase [Clostridiales Family XIII bacterium]|jgi:transketolase|nr:transketolase [Clostridiales Family XIII bacterium]